MTIQHIHSAHSLEDLIKNALSRNLAAARSGHVKAHVDWLNNVELTGHVGSWHQKQLAQESLLSLPSVRAVQNNIDVVYARVEDLACDS